MPPDRTIARSAACLLLAGIAGCALVLDLERGSLGAADGGPPAGEGGVDDPNRAARYAAAVLADGPLAYYPFVEAAGAATVANRAPATGSASARERDGAALGATLGLAGALGAADRAMTAGSAGARVELGWNGLPSGNEPFAIELALRGRSGAASGTVLAHRDSAAGGTFAGYRIAVEGADVLFERVAATGERGTVRAAGAVRADRWTHVVASGDGVRMSLLVDGEPAESIRTDNVRTPGTGTKLTLGSSGPDDPPFGGSIDEVAVYKEEIAIEKVKAHVAAFNR